MSDETRQQLLERLTRRLDELDVGTLQQLDELTRPSSAVDAGTGSFTRRQFVTWALVGGGTGLVLAAGGGFAALIAARAENLKLKGLLSLYEALERVGLDAIAELGISTVAGLLEGIENGALLLKRGVEAVEDALNLFTSLFPTIRDGISWAENLVSSLSDKLARLEEAIGSVVERASPLTDALGEFFNLLLSLLPDSIEMSVRDTLGRVEAVITSIPEAVEGLNTRLLTPLRQHWFGDKAAQRLETTLVEPITTGLLDPLEAHLSALAGLMDEWEANLAHPVREALQERQAIREQIARYREQNGLL
ncbi:MAG: hypothetical protein ACE5NP_10485 [Anaerolineae bacterium]